MGSLSSWGNAGPPSSFILPPAVLGRGGSSNRHHCRIEQASLRLFFRTAMVGVPRNPKLISATVHLHNHLCHHCRHKARDSPGVYLLVCLADKRMGIVGSKGDGGGIQQFHRPTRHIDTCLAIGVIYVLFFIPLPFIQLHNRHHHLLLLFPRRTGRPDLPWLDRCACHSCFPPCPSTVGASPYLRLLRVAYWLRPTIIRLRVIWLPAPRIHQASPASPCGCSPRRAPPSKGTHFSGQSRLSPKSNFACDPQYSTFLVVPSTQVRLIVNFEQPVEARRSRRRSPGRREIIAMPTTRASRPSSTRQTPGDFHPWCAKTSSSVRPQSPCQTSPTTSCLSPDSPSLPSPVRLAHIVGHQLSTLSREVTASERLVAIDCPPEALGDGASHGVLANGLTHSNPSVVPVASNHSSTPLTVMLQSRWESESGGLPPCTTTSSRSCPTTIRASRTSALTNPHHLMPPSA